MLKVMILWAAVLVSSPFIVLIGADQFQETGWLAIGSYSFDIYDGIYRSVYFWIVSCPVILALYCGRPILKIRNEINLNIGFKVNELHVVAMIVFCLVAFFFNLGVTGVETDTGVWKLSGIAHYIRSYLFLFFISVYIYGSKKYKFYLVVIYSLVAGLTAGSRFVAVLPLVLMFIKELYVSEKGIGSKRSIMLILLIYVLFSIVTAFRLILLDENYSLFRVYEIFQAIDFGDHDLAFQGLSQLLLRLGVGRDVILSYQVSLSGVCDDLYGLFFKSGSCRNPPLDFYGMALDNDKFFLAPPMLSSLFVYSDVFVIKLFVSIAYAVLVYVMCRVLFIVKRIPFGDLLLQPAYLLLIVFVTIGPIFFAWYLIFAIIMFVVMCNIVSLVLKCIFK